MNTNEITAIIAAVARSRRLLPQDLIGPARTSAISDARFVAWWLIVASGLSMAKAGAMMHRRGHTPVARALRVVRASRADSADYRAETDAIRIKAAQAVRRMRAEKLKTLAATVAMMSKT